MGKSDKTTKSAPAKKVVKKPSASKPEPTPAPAPTPVVAEEKKNEVVEASTEQSSGAEALFAELQTDYANVVNVVSAYKKKLTVFEKLFNKEMKQSKKLAAQKMKRAGNRAPAGFIKPTLISDELAKFLGKPTGEMMPRTAVTKEITSYIKANNLQDPSNGRTILPDAALAKLLKIKKDDTLTYFNLQRYMAPHFPSTGSSASTSA